MLPPSSACPETITTMWLNQITGPNAGGRRQLPIRTSLAARVAQFWRSAHETSFTRCWYPFRKKRIALRGGSP